MNNYKKHGNIMDLAIIALILVIVAASYIAMTRAKYTSQDSDGGGAYVAKWNFVDGDSTTNIVLTADSTKYPNIKSGTIAPGTSGTFDVYLNANGSDSAVAYTISIEPTSRTTIT